MSSTADEAAGGVVGEETESVTPIRPSSKRPKIVDEHPADAAAAAAAAAAAGAVGQTDSEAHASHPYYQYPYSHYPYHQYDYSAYGHEHPAYARSHFHGHGPPPPPPPAEQESSAVVSPPDQAGSNAAGNATSTPTRGDMPPLSYGYDDQQQSHSYYYPPSQFMHVAPSPVNAASSLAKMASQSSPENKNKRKASYDHHYESGYYGHGAPGAGAYSYGEGGEGEEDDHEEEDGERLIFRLYRDVDKEVLSERQCYVRQCYIQAFTAVSSDVSSRHSKGAQMLRPGQVGIRCVFCQHLPSGDRAERAVCYPRSVSRLYQTIADMQRFHFENCECIPGRMKETYRTLKTSRKRGQESPQQYWIRSAYELGLFDNPDGGIFYSASQAVGDPHDVHEEDAATAEAEAAAHAAAVAAAAAAEYGEGTVHKEAELGDDGGIPV